MKHLDVNTRKAQAIEYYLHLADAFEHQAKEMRISVEQQDFTVKNLVSRCRYIANNISRMGGVAKLYMDAIERKEKRLFLEKELEGLQNESCID
jgi:hypothetical protein